MSALATGLLGPGATRDFVAGELRRLAPAARTPPGGTSHDGRRAFIEAAEHLEFRNRIMEFVEEAKIPTMTQWEAALSALEGHEVKLEIEDPKRDGMALRLVGELRHEDGRWGIGPNDLLEAKEIAAVVVTNPDFKLRRPEHLSLIGRS